MAAIPSFYRRLIHDFPPAETKSLRHLQSLLARRPDLCPLRYVLHETDEYSMLYAESADFLFLDYLTVEPQLRGRGIGTAALGLLLAKAAAGGKFVLLEVDPPLTQTDVNRIRFYEKSGLALYADIPYNRLWSYDALVPPCQMQLMASKDTPTSRVQAAMRQVYANVHAWDMHSLYGRCAPSVEEVLPQSSSAAENTTATSGH